VRRLLSVHSSLQNLETALLLLPNEFLPLEDPTSLYSTSRLQALISQYRELLYLLTKIPSSSEDAFVQSLGQRVEKVKVALAKDIRDAMAAKRRNGDVDGVFCLLGLSRETDLRIITTVQS